MVIGFTGTQVGMTEHQKAEIIKLIIRLDISKAIMFGHHGDCIGADKEFHDIIVSKGIEPIIHPPSNSSKRAFCKPVVLPILPPKPYLERNHDIVDACDILIACPKGHTEELRSGTWATIRYARKQNKQIYIIYP